MAEATAEPSVVSLANDLAKLPFWAECEYLHVNVLTLDADS